MNEQQRGIKTGFHNPKQHTTDLLCGRGCGCTPTEDRGCDCGCHTTKRMVERKQT